MCARHRRQQRGLVAAALLHGLREYQDRRLGAPTPGYAREMQQSNSFQEPMIQGVAYMAPQYAQPIDPNPPAYEEVAPEQPRTLVDEKTHMYRLSTEEQVPPHAHEGYEPNTGLSSVPRSVTAPAIETPYSAAPLATPLRSVSHKRTSNDVLDQLLEAIKLYFDTQIKLNQDHPAKARKLESKKARKLAKAEKKFHEHMAKGKDSKHEAKMVKRAEKMEKWTEWVLKKSIERNPYPSQGHQGHARHADYGMSAPRLGHMEHSPRTTVV